MGVLQARKPESKNKYLTKKKKKNSGVKGRGLIEHVCRAAFQELSPKKAVWKDIGGNQEKRVSSEQFARYEAEVEEMLERRERLALRNKAKSEKHSRYRIKRGARNENVFAQPNGLRENAETAIFV